jgi:hypothetical protein
MASLSLGALDNLLDWGRRAVRIAGSTLTEVTGFVVFGIPRSNIGKGNLDQAVGVRAILIDLENLGTDAVTAPSRNELHPGVVIDSAHNYATHRQNAVLGSYARNGTYMAIPTRQYVA